MTQGFVSTGAFRSVFAVDFEQPMVDTYRENFDPTGEHSVRADVREVIASRTLPSCDVIVGGPPCQGFSLLNKGRLRDERRALTATMVDAAILTGASVVVIENVRQLLSSREYLELLERLKAEGYSDIDAGVLCAADFGVPQMRYRAFVLASRVGPIKLPEPTHAAPEKAQELMLRPWTTVEEAIGELPPPEGTEFRDLPPPLDLHFGRRPTEVSQERYRAVPPGGNRFDLQANRPDITPECWKRKVSGGTDLFGRLWWDRPSVTIRTEFFKPEKGRYLHPVQHRPITHREGARIQGFPDDFRFKGSKIEVAKQIGNAVPPGLAAAVAGSVHECLSGATRRKMTLDLASCVAR